MRRRVRRRAPLHAVAYDLADDRERRRCARLLAGFGFRVQRSVFECRLTRGEQRALLTALEVLNVKTGHVRVYRLLETVPVRAIGAAQPSPEERFAFVL